MANKQELEESLITRVSKKIGKDNQTLEEVVEKIMKSVDNWAQEHKKELVEISEETRQEFRKPSFLLSKLIKIKYAEEKLTRVVYLNLKRAPGNLSVEQRMLAMYDTFAKFDYKCPYSGTLLLGGKEKIHLEHIIPVAMGGPTDDWNCIPICGTCNSSKHDKHLLDWWKDNRQVEEEYKLVKIFEHMTSKLLDETNTIKYVKHQNNPMHLDAITFLNQLLNHIEENKQYIFNKEFMSVKEKQNAINSKLKELKSIFEKVVKKNDRNTKTDKQYFNEQKAIVKYVKSLGVSSYYKIAYTYFNTIKEMQNLGKPEEEIQEFCIAQDDWFIIFYEKLIEYKKAHNGSFAGVTQDKEIGGQVSGVRKAYKYKDSQEKPKRLYNLTPEMIAKLEVIGFSWVVEKDDWFSLFYEKVIAFKESHNGSFNGATKDKEIGETINNVRRAYKGKGTTKLTPEMIEKLDAIGFPWVIEKEEWFTSFYEKLIAYKEAHNGSFDGVTTDVEIGKKVGRIRQAYKYKDLEEKPTGLYTLTPEMIEKLDAIGFPWVVKKDWFTPFYKKLIAYKEAHNGSFTGVRKDEEIGGIVGSIRYAYKYKNLQEKPKRITQLTEEMIDRLDIIGFPWKDDWFAEFYEKLIEYRDKEILDKNGKIKPKGSFDGVATDVEIGGQVNGIRQAKKGKGGTKLTEEMIEKLNAIGFPWEGRTKKQKEENLLDKN